MWHELLWSLRMHSEPSRQKSWGFKTPKQALHQGSLWKWSEVTQSCPTLCDPMDCSLPGSSVLGIFQAIVLEWIAISFSRGSSQPRDRTRVFCIVDRCFTSGGKCFKKGLTLLDIREMQTKSTMRCSKQPPEWLRKRGEKRTKDYTKTWQECRTTRTFVYCLWECKLVQPLWKTAWQDPLVILLVVPEVSLLVVYPAKAHTYVHWTTCTIFGKWTGLRKS